MKILIVSAWENNESMYPHLRTVLDLLNENGIQAEYYQFFERGYSFASSLSCAKAFKLWKRVIKHLWLLKRFCDKNNFDKILVIDHFTYVCANFILPKNKLVFWSFDIMGDDSTYYKFRFIRFMLYLNSIFLKHGGKLVIQNSERCGVLERTLKMRISAGNVCYLPVFIQKLDVEVTHSLHDNCPILMQCSSFDGDRYTEELIAQYQSDSAYVLYLHGMHIHVIEEYIKDIPKKPILLVDKVLPGNVYQIIEKSDIGFLGMKLLEDNCKYLYGASGQLLEFLRCGKPVISFGNNNVGKILEENHAGIEIGCIEDLNDAVIKIKADYQTYSKNALNLFLRDFDSYKLMSNLLKFLKG